MLEVVSLEDARSLVQGRFGKPDDGDSSSCLALPLTEVIGRAIAHDVVAVEGVPAFDRSTVDGFAVVAPDTFGCSEALPALLELAGEIEMGAAPSCACAYLPSPRPSYAFLASVSPWNLTAM